MPALHIRDVEEKLVQRLKAEAALGGVTLREYVIGRLGGQKTEDRGSGDMPRPAEVPVAKRSACRPERVPVSREPCKHGADPRFCKHEECRRK